MKKYSKTIAISVVIIVCIIYLISNVTYTSYVSEADGQVDSKVAGWNILINNVLVSTGTEKNVWKLFKEIGLVKEGKIEDLSGNAVDVYILSQDFSIFQPIPLQTLSFLINVSNSNVIKVYAYLLNKYKWKQKENQWYSFTIKELLSAIGYSYKNDNVKMMTDILEMLKAIKLIDYEITYYKQVGKPPIPMHTLKVAREYKPREEKKETKQPFICIDYGFDNEFVF